MISQETRDRWVKMTCYLINHQDGLNTWELSLLGSAAVLVGQGIDLSFRQSKALRRIYRREEGRIG